MSTFFTWICRICLFALLVTVALPFSINASNDEEEWIKTYGTHKNDSGIWPLARYLETNKDKLKIYCIRAHEQLNETILKNVDAHVSFWLMTFQNRSIEPIWADMIQYCEQRTIGSTEVFSYKHMIKGNRPDCVFYIKEHQQHVDKLSEMVFENHVCGVEGFEIIETKKKKGADKTHHHSDKDDDFPEIVF